MKRIGAWLLGLGFGLAVAGCSSDKKAEDVPPEGPKYPDLHSFCAAIASSECTKALTSTCLVDTQTCVATVQDACVNGKMDVTAGLNLNAYNPKKAEDCVNQVAGEYGASGVVVITSDAHVGATQKCDPVFSKLLSKGLPCNTDNDCDVGLFCYFQPSATPVQGTCETATQVMAGQDCSAAGSQCPTGMRCTVADMICGQIKKTEGATCWAGDPCQTGQYCDLTQGTNGQGVCTTPLPMGSDCTLDDQCSSHYCAQIGSQHKCVDSISIGTGSIYCPNFGGQAAM